MDISWVWELKISCIICTIATLICSLIMIIEMNREDKHEVYISIALNCWLLLNIITMLKEVFKLEQYNNFIVAINAVLSLFGIVFLLLLVVNNQTSKFKRL